MKINDITFNAWWLSLPKGRQQALIEDKWMLAEAAFEAVKELSKPETKVYFKETYYGGVDFSYYYLSNIQRGDRQYHFSSREEAIMWAKKNGYRLQLED